MRKPPDATAADSPLADTAVVVADTEVVAGIPEATVAAGIQETMVAAEAITDGIMADTMIAIITQTITVSALILADTVAMDTATVATVGIMPRIIRPMATTVTLRTIIIRVRMLVLVTTGSCSSNDNDTGMIEVCMIHTRR